MVKSLDHPELEFVQAKSYQSGRALGPPIWFVWHDMEASEWSGRAESTAEYFRTLPDGRSVSAHYCADNDSVVQCVRLEDTAHTAGGNPGNPLGINIELSGFARQTRAEWLDEFGLAMFQRMAPIIRSDAKRFGIPLRWLSDDQLRARQPGMTTHGQVGRVFGGTTHTDPGPAFPYDVVLKIMAGGFVVAGARFTFQGFPDEADYSPATPGGPSRTHITDGVRYLVQQYSSTADKIKTQAGFGPIINLTPANTGYSTYAVAVRVYCGRSDPGELAGGDGATAKNFAISLSGIATPQE